MAVEASTRWYARHFGEDEEGWGVVALLHDFDYEIHPTLDKHPQDGAPILREEGYPEWVVEAVLSHAEHLHLERDTPLKRTLFACDELSGFVTACGYVRPDGIVTIFCHRAEMGRPAESAVIADQELPTPDAAIGPIPRPVEGNPDHRLNKAMLGHTTGHVRMVMLNR